MAKHLLNRRQFGARCAALSLSASSAMMAVQASAQVLDTGAESKPAARTVKFPDGTTVPALGQGSWHLGQGRHRLSVEEEAMRTGIALGMTVIDTSRNYGDGLSEKFIGRVIAGQRDRVFLVSKVQEDEIVQRAGATGAGEPPVLVPKGDVITRLCEQSLARLGTDYLDLYLLHSPVPRRYLSGVVAKFEQLRAAGKIRAWGVSNFNVDQMEELFRVPDGHRCATNQVSYSLRDRRIEHDVLPWCQQHNMPVMAASPLGGIEYARQLLGERTLAELGAMHGCSPAAVALAFVIRSGNVIAIPESGDPAHVKENAVALSIRWIPSST